MDEKTLISTQEARLMNLNDQLIFPKLDQMLESRLYLAIGKFNGGEKDFISDIAFMAALAALKTSLKQTQDKGNAALAKLNNTKE